MSRQAVILAGGLGTRLRTVIGDTPKALAEVGGKPVLGHHLELCRRHGFDDVVLLLGHAAGKVIDWVGDGSCFGLSCRAIIEETPLGTAGAVLAAKSLLRDDFLVMYCDTMLDVDLDRFWHFAVRRRATAALLVHPNDHPFDSDLVVTDANDRILGFSRWRESSVPIRNLASAALYVMNQKSLASVPRREGVLDFGRHVFPDLIARGENLVAYRSVEYIKDMGTPERLAKVNRDYAIGKVDPSRSGWSRPAVFLDRDGVLNVERDGVLGPSTMELLPGAAEGVRKLNAAGLPAIVVTNQPYVSHGVLSESALELVHAAMECDLAHEHAFVDAIYYCPHHPHSGHPGERAELKIDCECRKPKPGMILSAAGELGLDLGNSWMIGDRTGDIEAGRRAGLRTILVRGGHGGKDGANLVEPDYVFDDLCEAAEFIVSNYPRMRAYGDALASRLTPGMQILIGGQSRAGKSIWARALRDAVSTHGFEVLLLSLDDWLVNLSERGPDVLGRYDLATVSDVLTRLRTATNPVKVVIPVYDRARRQRIGERRIEVTPATIVICEGAPALALRADGAVRLAVSINEARRRERFDSFYQARGESDAADVYWHQRKQDEVPVIEKINQTAELLPTLEAETK